jgi:hypothetical protein
MRTGAERPVTRPRRPRWFPTRSNSEYTIKLTGEGITVEQQVGKGTALRILNIVMGGTGAAPVPPAPAGNIHGTAPSSQSP